MGRRIPASERVGQQYGRLTVKCISGKDEAKHAIFECECSCGRIVHVRCYDLSTGKTKSCGCYRKQRASEVHTTHGGSSLSLFAVWRSMIQRCTNPNCKQYDAYGGRGIIVCEDWLKFENFYRDMGDRPSDLHSIDRIDNNGNYCKENCRWATQKEQCNNKRSNRVFTYNGKAQSLQMWADDLGISVNTLRSRLSSGWDIPRVLTEPVNNPKVVSDV